MRTALLAMLSLAGASSLAYAQSSENVAVVINEASADSQRIGEHYARVRNLPAANILRITTSTDDAIDRDGYVGTIERPLGAAIVRSGLQDRLLYIVLTKGIPLRVSGTSGIKGTHASVDSELTLLYRRLTGLVTAAPGAVDNPYYLGARDVSEARPFTHREHDIYLVTRLDAFSADEAIALVDRAQSPRRDGRFVLDQRAAAGAQGTGDAWMQRASVRLGARLSEGRVLLEQTPKAARDVDEVLGYYGWGAADPERRERRSGIRFVPGAIAAGLASFDARTFREPPAEWRPTASSDKAAWFEGAGDALIGDLIREGVTGVSGQVGEAYLLGAVRPEILFPAYSAGFNLAEAYYLATPTLSWQSVIVGDPLTTAFDRKVLARAELEEEIDPVTGLPRLFSTRRVRSFSQGNPGVPEPAITAVVRAMTLIGRDEKPAAAAALSKALELAPRQPNWMALVASLQEQTGEYDAAITAYREILAVQPGNFIALNNLANALAVYRKQPAEAWPLARKALSLAPRNANVVDTTAWVEHLLGNDHEALRLLESALALDGTVAEIHLHAAVVYEALGNTKRADEALKTAVRLDAAIADRDEARQLRTKLESLKTPGA